MLHTWLFLWLDNVLHLRYHPVLIGGLIESNPNAQKIDELIKDPVKKEKALSELANKLNAKITDDEVKEAGEAIPISTEHYGSSDEIDFDISEYLDS